MNITCTIQLSLDGEWQDAATISINGKEVLGTNSPTTLEYLDDYAFSHLHRRDAAALSVNFPVNLDVHRLHNWPSFLVDLLPAGAHRLFWAQELRVPTDPISDWEFLSKAAMNPIGNLRIKEAANDLLVQTHDGFSRDDVILKKQNFLEYMRHNGAPVGGSSGAQGDAPKFLLSEDHRNRWHPSGSIPECEINQEWLVKFTRGQQAIDYQILHAEKCYYDIARECGLYTGKALEYNDGCLFIPRFDVTLRKDRLIRQGVESLASALGVHEFGQRPNQEAVIEVINRISSDPVGDIVEWLKRDILNVCLGNTDNHIRNTAFCRYHDGTIRLAPLYDFAPMALDPSGIVRACRWKLHETGGIPNWLRIIKDSLGNTSELSEPIAQLLSRVSNVPDQLKAMNVAERIIDHVAKKTELVRIENAC